MQAAEVGKLVYVPNNTYTIGRAKDNDIVLNDRRVSRRHAHIVAEATQFKIIDGYYVNGEIQAKCQSRFCQWLAGNRKSS